MSARQVFVAVAFGLLLPAQWLAAAPIGEKLLPHDTLAYATIADRTQFQRAWNASSFGAMAQDPRFARFFAAVRDRFEHTTAGLQEGYGVNLWELWNQVEGELMLGLVKDGSGQISLAVVADLGDNSETVAAFVEDWTQRLRTQGAEETRIQARGTTLHSWGWQHERSAQSFSFALIDGHIVASDQLETVLGALTRLQGELTNRLADNDDYRFAMQKVSAAQPPVRWYVNPVALVETAIGTNLQNNPQLTLLQGLISASGLDGFRAYAGSMSLAEGDFDSVTQTFGYIEQPARGILKVFELAPAAQKPPAWVKDDVSLYAQINWSLPQAYDAVAQAADGLQGPGSFDAFIGQMQLPGTQLQLKRDFVDQLTGSLHVVADVPADLQDLADQPVLFGIEVRDVQRSAEIAGELAQAAGAVSRTVDDTVLYEVELPAPVPGKSLKLGMAVAEGTWMLSSQAGFLEQVLKDRATKRPLADSLAYQRVAEHFPDQTGMISYQRQDHQFEGLYELLRSGGTPGGLPLYGQPLGLDLSSLPPFPSMSRYLQSTGSYIEPTPDGFRSVSFGLNPREQ